jgi:hypothetical protein
MAAFANWTNLSETTFLLQMLITVGAFQHQTVCAQRRQMLAAGDDAACRHDRDFHRHLAALP